MELQLSGTIRFDFPPETLINPPIPGKTLAFWQGVDLIPLWDLFNPIW